MTFPSYPNTLASPPKARRQTRQTRLASTEEAKGKATSKSEKGERGIHGTVLFKCSVNTAELKIEAKSFVLLAEKERNCVLASWRCRDCVRKHAELADACGDPETGPAPN